MKNKRRIFVITGMSGAGKSQALKWFEDFGFYCVDNLPVALLEEFAAFVRGRRDLGDVALGIDIREGKSLESLPRTLSSLRGSGFDFKVLYLDSSDSALIRRFSETRHRHPLGSNVEQSIRLERRLIDGLRAGAWKIIDTTAMTLGELKEAIARILDIKRSARLRVTVMSFGYKYGLPLDADIVMDVRFLANPNYVPELKAKTGHDKAVARHIMRDPKARGFLERFCALARYLLPLYGREGKSHLTIAIGCTGGRHRSVFMAAETARRLSSAGYGVYSLDRDIGHDKPHNNNARRVRRVSA
ncbi:MAG: RNase adapter RapZ [Elusimicrobiales bacterium]